METTPVETLLVRAEAQLDACRRRLDRAAARLSSAGGLAAALDSLAADGAGPQRMVPRFEKAIEANPRSGFAHFEAAVLCEKHKQNFAAAIYHFERYLELRPNDRYADVVNQHIMACKQELAKTVYLGPVTQSLQREFENLTQQNKTLREELERWKAKAQAQAMTPGAAPSASGAPQAARPGALTATPVPSAASLSNTNTVDRLVAGGAAPRTHTVKPGETPAAIAKRYGLRVNVLLAANPRIEARRLQVGQTLVLPSRQN